jgi:hypothetical protein
MIENEGIVFQLEQDNLNLIEKIKTKYVDTGLSYGWKANGGKPYDQGHWNKLIIPNSKRFPCDHNDASIIDYHPEIKQLWEILKSKIGSRGFYRAYINSYTFGTDGYAHQDDLWIQWIQQKYGNNVKTETSIFYLNDKWDIDWGGETVLYENLSHDNNDIIKSVLPKYGRVFVFQSDKYHASRPISRICQELRSVFVIKTMDKNTVALPVKFINDLTKNIDHSGRSFFDHLFGTMLKLEERKVSDDLLLAGLYHAIYGTEFFEFKANINREKIKYFIGEYAEMLAFEFCNMTNRMQTLMTNSNNYSKEILSDLIQIEICNLQDQNWNGNLNPFIEQLENKFKLLG